MVPTLRSCFSPNFNKSSLLAIVPSSFMISHITPAPEKPANDAKSHAASV